MLVFGPLDRHRCHSRRCVRRGPGRRHVKAGASNCRHSTRRPSSSAVRSRHSASCAKDCCGPDSFEAVSRRLEALQGDIDKVKMERVEQAFANAQKNIAAGWAPSAEQLSFCARRQQGVGPAAEAARKDLESSVSRQDNVTPRLEAMMRCGRRCRQGHPVDCRRTCSAWATRASAPGFMEIDGRIEASPPMPRQLPLIRRWKRCRPGSSATRRRSMRLARRWARRLRRLRSAGYISDRSQIIAKQAT